MSDNHYLYRKTIDFLNRVKKAIELSLGVLEGKNEMIGDVKLTQKWLGINAGINLVGYIISYGVNINEDSEKQQSYENFLRHFCYFFPLKEDFEVIDATPPSINEIREAVYAQ